jgi:hypothetical protein
MSDKKSQVGSKGILVHYQCESLGRECRFPYKGEVVYTQRLVLEAGARGEADGHRRHAAYRQRL